MAQLEITRFLKQAVLDSAFRELVLTDPEKSFAGFALSDAEKQILKAKSPEISTLVATAITDTMNPYDGPKSADEQGAINYVTEFIWASALIWPANVSPQPDLIWEPKALNTPPINDTLFIWAAEKSGSSSKRAGTTIDVGLPDNISAEETRKEINSTVDKINKSDGDERFGNLLKLLSLVENIPNLKK